MGFEFMDIYFDPFQFSHPIYWGKVVDDHNLSGFSFFYGNLNMCCRFVMRIERHCGSYYKDMSEERETGCLIIPATPAIPNYSFQKSPTGTQIQ